MFGISLCVPIAVASFIAAGVASPLFVDSTLRTAASNVNTSLTFLFQNNLNLTDDQNHVGAILLDAMPSAYATAACQALGESLLSKSSIQAYQDDFIASLSYNAYAGRAACPQSYQINEGLVALPRIQGNLTYLSSSDNQPELPVLCTQSSNQNDPTSAVATASNEICVASGGNMYIGFRNQKSFRFLGVPFADPPGRFVHSKINSRSGQVIQTTNYSAQCAQISSGSEDCLYLNIQTPYIPRQNSTRNLRPVMFWIHGGGFTGGNGSSSGGDGGQLASREDIVVVNIQYRLSTLGFLAIPNTNITGNYGIGDQVTALQWIVEHIAQFGGDPQKITIMGESAGAGSVRVLLGSPPAIGNFQGAVVMSNLGGGMDLGYSNDYATNYSLYNTIEESFSETQGLFAEAGCNQNTLSAQVSCLQTVPALTIVELPTFAHNVVQDGKFVTTSQLVLSGPNNNTARVPVVFGTTMNDGASYSNFLHDPPANESVGLQGGLGISATYADAIIASGLFPYYDTGNASLDSFNVSQRVATDNQFRCIDEATAYAGATTGAFSKVYYYQMQRGDVSTGYDPQGLGGPPITPGYPYGNPNLPYFRVHASDGPWIFGDLYPLRDADDLYSVQISVGYFAEFVRSGQPNPAEGYLEARGYETMLNAVATTGQWEAIAGENGPVRLLDYPPVIGDFIDKPQCAWLNYSLNYYLQ